MNRLLLVFVTVFAIASLGITAMAAGNNFPSLDSPGDQPAKPAMSRQQQLLYYGYVPPPPIRHTWPGGYRVILHEMMNNLMEHITDHY